MVTRGDRLSRDELGSIADEHPPLRPHASRWQSRRVEFVRAASVVWLPWLVARLVVLAGLVLAKYEVRHFHIAGSKAILESHSGLLGSDASWYQAIAAHGYHSLPRAAVRFFPLLPLLARGAFEATHLSVGTCLLLIVNVGSFLIAVGIYLLVVSELGDATVANRCVWLISVAPPAFILVMGYSESIFMGLAILCFYHLRRANWWWAALLGFAAATARPLGCLLVIPALVEMVRLGSNGSTRDHAGRVVAVLAPAAGMFAFLSWVQVEFGSFFLPLTIQQQPGRHGGITDPFSTLYHAVTGLLGGNHIGTGLHVPWVIVSIVLLAVSFRKLPWSYSLFSLGVLLAALSGSNLESFERYAFSAFPLVIAGSTLLRSHRVSLAILIMCGAGMLGYALLAFLGAYVP
jgi:hypothetical protein